MQYFVVDYMLLTPLEYSPSAAIPRGWIQHEWSYRTLFGLSHEVPSGYGADNREQSFLDSSEIVDHYWSSMVTGFV